MTTKLTPISSTNILSNPTGPKELLTMFAMAVTAVTVYEITQIIQSGLRLIQYLSFFLTILRPYVFPSGSFAANVQQLGRTWCRRHFEKLRACVEQPQGIMDIVGVPTSYQGTSKRRVQNKRWLNSLQQRSGGLFYIAALKSPLIRYTKT